MKNIRYILITISLALFPWQNLFAQQGELLVRISEIEVKPEFREEYNAILKEEAEASLRLEPGVIAIFPMYVKEDPDEVRILEIYANKEAYESHLKTPHFIKYKTETLDMIKSLKLVDMEVLDLASMESIFTKINADPRSEK